MQKKRWTSTRGEEGKKLFRGDKSYLGNRSVRVHLDESVSGKIFIEFVALIIRNRMYCQLKDEMEEYVVKPDYMTVPAAIRELEKIEMIRQMDGIYRLDHAITARQKKLYSRPKPSMKLPLPTWRQSWQGRMNLLPKTLLDAFKKRGKSYDAVMRYLKEGLRK